MTILIEQQTDQLVEEKKILAEDNNDQLVMPKTTSNDGFEAPEINSFGYSFFRDFHAENEIQKIVEEFYRLNHINQTYDFVKRMWKEYEKLDKAEMSLWECCELLNDIVDDSDPDLYEPQIEHLFQTAEAIRKDYPNEDWLQLTGLIHGCGVENVVMSWGHDDYMYLVAKKNGTSLPAAALFIIRFHSFYSLHKEGAYTHLMNQEDKENLNWLKIFSKYDLYSKSKARIDVEKVKQYYLSLIEKYFPAKLRW